MSDPKVGMRYKDAIKTATRHAKEGSHNIVDSMTNQVRRHEGDKAARHFKEEALRRGSEERNRGRKYF